MNSRNSSKKSNRIWSAPASRKNTYSRKWACHSARCIRGITRVRITAMTALPSLRATWTWRSTVRCGASPRHRGKANVLDKESHHAAKRRKDPGSREAVPRAGIQDPVREKEAGFRIRPHDRQSAGSVRLDQKQGLSGKKLRPRRTDGQSGQGLPT